MMTPTKTIVYIDPDTKKANVTYILGDDTSLISKIIPTGADFVEVDDHECICHDDPQMTFLGAWKIDSKRKVCVDMIRARDVHMNNLREIRNERLQELDTESVIALGKGDKKSVKTVETKKQALRDLPKTVLPLLKKAKTPYDLNNIFPPELV